MDSVFLRSFDDVLNEVLTIYSNLDNPPDLSVGSVAFVDSTHIAQLLLGLYRYCDYITRQITPNEQTDTQYLNLHGAVYQIPRVTADTDKTYLDKILTELRSPSAGGNAADFERWAVEESPGYDTTGLSPDYGLITVSAATVITWPEGVPGTVGVYIVPSNLSIIDDLSNDYEEQLQTITQTYIQSVQPVPMFPTSVISAKKQLQNIDLDYTEATTGAVDESVIVSEIQDYLNTRKPNESIFKSQIESIAINNGAESAVVTNLASEETAPTLVKNFFIAGTVTVTKV